VVRGVAQSAGWVHTLVAVGTADRLRPEGQFPAAEIVSVADNILAERMGSVARLRIVGNSVLVVAARPTTHLD
ncbi:hypothetical protein FWF64_03390, partial [Candidatus Saccharibacteria bacterium]|nr:hypothetical protein [Candidatus Saccharibacteria bacterium]